MSRRHFPLLGLAAFVCHCDPVFDMSGSVQRTDEAPIEGATVSVECGNGGDLEATTDENGKFEESGIVDVSDECTGKIVVEGEPAQKFDPIEHCTDGDRHGCRAMKAKLVIPYPEGG